MPRTPRPLLMALLADVKQNPDDLTPWLVLCDWLEEQDDEADRARGEYCRLCFDKLGQKTYASDWEQGEQRRHLYRTYHAAWFGPLLPLRPKIEKGLLMIDSDKLSEHLDALEADPEAWAWLGSLRLWQWIEGLSSPEPDRGWIVMGLNTLAVAMPMKDPEVALLASWPAMRGVRVLKLFLPGLGRNQARHLVESPFLHDLKKLEITLYNAIHAKAGRPQAIKKLLAAFGDRLHFIGI